MLLRRRISKRSLGMASWKLRGCVGRMAGREKKKEEERKEVEKKKVPTKECEVEEMTLVSLVKRLVAYG